MNIDVKFNETNTNFDTDFGETTPGGTTPGATTNDHSQLTNRDKSGQHPIKAITGLEKALNEKLNSSALPSAIDTALGQAKESGEFDGKTPYIKNGNWWIGDEDTGVPASSGGGMTPEEKAQLEQNTEDIENLKSQIGDIETALDNIIALQVNYIVNGG